MCFVLSSSSVTTVDRFTDVCYRLCMGGTVSHVTHTTHATLALMTNQPLATNTNSLNHYQSLPYNHSSSKWPLSLSTVIPIA